MRKQRQKAAVGNRMDKAHKTLKQFNCRNNGNKMGDSCTDTIQMGEERDPGVPNIGEHFILLGKQLEILLIIVHGSKNVYP